MIGFVVGESYIALEFRPIFASEKMKWASLVLKKRMPSKYWGEWGYALSRQGEICVFKGQEMYFKETYGFIDRLFKKYNLGGE